jgi:ABC-type nitrate/sulfonate/bicarbonate transport system permease component
MSNYSAFIGTLTVKGRRGFAQWLPVSIRGKIRPIVLAATVFVVLVLTWQLFSTFVFNPALLPTPLETFDAVVSMGMSGELWYDIAVSLYRILIGYALAAIVGISLGILIGYFRIVREITDPIIELLRPISPVAFVPVSILWFGIGEESKYFVIFYSAVIVILLNTAAGVAATPVSRLRAAQSLGADDQQLLLSIILPSAMPYILTGMRVALGFAFMGVVAAEMIGASVGIGYLIMQSQMLVQPARMFVGLITLGIVGLVIDRLYRMVVALTTRRYVQYQRFEGGR